MADYIIGHTEARYAKNLEEAVDIVIAHLTSIDPATNEFYEYVPSVYRIDEDDEFNVTEEVEYAARTKMECKGLKLEIAKRDAIKKVFASRIANFRKAN